MTREEKRQFRREFLQERNSMDSKETKINKQTTSEVSPIESRSVRRAPLVGLGALGKDRPAWSE